MSAIHPQRKPTRAERKPFGIDTSALQYSKEHYDREAAFRQFVNSFGCLLSGLKNQDCGGITEFAHITTGGLQKKGSDFFGVPLCTNHHTARGDSYHQLGSVEAFDAWHGTTLWRENAEFLAEWIRRQR